MNMEQPVVELRKYKRFKVKEGALAFFNPNPTIIGSIIDVRKNGLAFTYMKTDFEMELSPAVKLDILMSIDGFYLDYLPFEAIADILLPAHYAFSTIVMKRLCLKFGQLSRDQEKQLDYFISHYAIGPV